MNQYGVAVSILINPLIYKFNALRQICFNQKQRNSDDSMVNRDFLRNRTCLITGASRGLGREMALTLGKQGVRLAITARDRDDLQTTACAIENAGGTVFAASTDIRDEIETHALIQRILDQYGRLDILVNNAGLMGGELTFPEINPSRWREIVDTNLWGTFLCCHAALPPMMHQGEGVIVNITSGAATRTGFLNLPYGVSKAGIDRLTLGLGTELKAHGIACVSLSPPVSATDTVRRIYPDRDVEEWAQPPELTARALCALLEKHPMRYTGQVLSVREYLRSRSLY